MVVMVVMVVAMMAVTGVRRAAGYGEREGHEACNNGVTHLSVSMTPRDSHDRGPNLKDGICKIFIPPNCCGKRDAVKRNRRQRVANRPAEAFLYLFCS